MKSILIISSVLLLFAIAPLPIGYYTLLRIVISFSAAFVIFNEIEKGISVWIILFGLIAILFNPISPIYLHDKNSWIPLDIASALIFFAKFWSIKQIPEKE